MAAQGSPNLLVRDFVLDPSRPFADIDQIFHNTEGYVGLRLIRLAAPQDNLTARHGLVYTFRTTADAMTAMTTHPTVVIRDATNPFHLEPYYGDFGESQTNLPLTADQSISIGLDISPPRKRLKKEPPPEKKLACKICFNELEGPYSTPCRRCKTPICYDCLTMQFKTAMKEIDRMPVSCCGCVMHHEVVKGILPVSELEEYKQKYDERMNAVDPLYCPVPTCSTFIPPRLFKPNETTIACHVCETVICTKCKQHAEDNHECAKEDPRKFILETFHYKICPRCGTGVMRMHGCPHIRCQCGAHWCWDCQRPMNACYQKPCRAARDEGNYSDGDDGDPDSDDENSPNLPIEAAPVPTPMTVVTCTEAEQAAADSLVALRDGPVVHVVPADRLVVESGNNISPTEAITPIVTAEAVTIESGGTGQMPAIVHMDTSETALGADALGDATTQPGTEAPQAAEALTSSDAVQNTVPTHSVADTADQTATDVTTQQATVDPVPTNTAGTATAPEPAAAAPSNDEPIAEPVTEPAAPHIENLDDPDDFDWEGRDIDFGDEPQDETWDVWGCRHHFYDLSKDRIPQFWLVGVQPAIDTVLEIECMGCFKTTKAWDDDAELEAFRVKFYNEAAWKLDQEALKQQLAAWKAGIAEIGVNAESASSGNNGSKKLVSKLAVECRHGCGVVYCASCKKASRRRIRKERKAVDADN